MRPRPRLMLITVDWSLLADDRDWLWRDSFCLYAYLHPARDWLLYVGKADFATVRRRLAGDHKAVLFRDIHRAYGVDKVRVLHGAFALEAGGRRTSELLADTESLLIKRLQPFGNIQSRRSRISRPGMRVHCIGEWPFKRHRFHDKD